MRPWLARLAATALALTALAAFAPNAEANTQTISPVDVTVDATYNVCSFPISEMAHNVGFRIRFYDNNGEKYKAIWQITGQDVLSANDKSLTSDPYNWSAELDFAPGNVLISESVTGVAEKLVLPDGTLFLSAGWIDWLAV